MKPWTTRTFLFISGLLLLAIGGGLLLAPHAFHASNGIELGSDPSLLSEVRAPGGLLLASAVLILLGTFRPALRSMAIFQTVLVYGSFGVARLVGMAMDGLPSSGIVGAAVIELVIAALGLAILKGSRKTASRGSSMQLEVAATR